ERGVLLLRDRAPTDRDVLREMPMTKRLLIPAALLGSATAHAGVLQIHDEDNALTDRSYIESAAAAAPFDVHVLISSTRGHRAAFDRYVDQSVRSPNLV